MLSDPSHRGRKAALKSTKSSGTKLPDLKDHEAVQRFFLQEVQLGEELLARGDIEEGVEHLGNAVAVCGQPNQLLQVLQQTLPPQVFHLLLQRLPALGQTLEKIYSEKSPLRFPKLLQILTFCAVLPMSTDSCERGFSCHNRFKMAYRNSLKIETLDDLPRISVNEPSLSEFDPTFAIDKWDFTRIVAQSSVNVSMMAEEDVE
uniref:HAT C-terminal dimerisation domain-containing protein n=1 Tax=Timema genevievae TaxID=629358 RepID=A0A7R9PHA2_TIMGE|nr:unnamed protein product [Timema genevievae]